jgi:hypothetical protein
VLLRDGVGIFYGKKSHLLFIKKIIPKGIILMKRNYFMMMKYQCLYRSIASSTDSRDLPTLSSSAQFG